MKRPATHSPTPEPMCPTVRRTDAAIHVLRDLDEVLRSESAALQAMDFAAIDAAANRKVALESRLESSLMALDGVSPSPAHRETLLELRRQVGTLARENQRRLQATLAAVQGLLGELTGPAPSTYGPGDRTSPGTRAVLTSTLG